MKQRKKALRACAAILALTLLLAGCAAQTAGEQPPASAPIEAPTDSAQQTETAGREPVQTTLRLLVVDGAETGRLVLAGENAHEFFALHTENVPVCLDGAPADASALEDGMTVEITYSGDITQSQPAELIGAKSVSAWSRGTAQNPGGTTYDLCGLYLQVLEDLWARDEGLNHGAKYVSVDLSAAPGELSSAAKYAVAWVFADRHGALPLTLTYDELLSQGYLTGAAPEAADRYAVEWEDGLLFRITADEWADGEHYSLPVIKFSAEKWRSPLGAYGFSQCTALWSQMGSWGGYNVGGEFIA